MSGPLESVRRWWKHAGSGNSHDGNGNGKPHRDVPAVRPAAPRTPAWLAHYDRNNIPRTLNYPVTTLGKMIDQTADRFSDLPAVVYANLRWSYRELHTRVNRLAGGLARLGVKAGDHVLLTLPNCPEMIVSFFAIQKLGAIGVNVGPLMGADDLGHVMKMTQPKACIGLDLQAAMLTTVGEHSSIGNWIWVTLQGYQTVLRRLGYQIKLWQSGDRNCTTKYHIGFDELMEQAPARPPTIDPHPNNVAVLQATGGTTGSVKLAQLSHRNLLSNAMQVSVWMNARWGQERVLATLPMFHVYGLTLGLIIPVFQGGTIILETRFDTGECIDLIQKHKPTIFPIVPAICDAISNRVEESDDPPKFDGLRLCISGAAPLPQDVAERFERLTGSKIIEGFGLTEASPVTHANLPGQPRYGSIGLPMPDTQCRIVEIDDLTKEVSPGESGELLISGPQIFSGYFANPEATGRSLYTDNTGRTWLCTGDVMWMDADGFFHVVDRKKDMIIHSGLKVYPAKLERVLKTHPKVADAAAIGRPHPVHTEDVVAFVVLKDEETSLTALADELRMLCRKHLAPYEVPAKIEFTQTIPRSALGKVLKKELRKLPAAPTLPQPAQASISEATKPTLPEQAKEVA